MRIPGHDRCFVCGEGSEIGLDFYERDGWMCSHFHPTDRLIGFPNVVHGGILASVLAEAMGMAVSKVARRFLGRKITVEYLAPVRPGGKYRVCGKVTGREGRKVFATASLYAEDGTLCAEGDGLFVVIT